MKLADVFESVGTGGTGASAWSEPTKMAGMGFKDFIPDDSCPEETSEEITEAEHPWRQSHKKSPLSDLGKMNRALDRMGDEFSLSGPESEPTLAQRPTQRISSIDPDFGVVPDQGFTAQMPSILDPEEQEVEDTRAAGRERMKEPKKKTGVRGPRIRKNRDDRNELTLSDLEQVGKDITTDEEPPRKPKDIRPYDPYEDETYEQWLARTAEETGNASLAQDAYDFTPEEFREWEPMAWEDLLEMNIDPSSGSFQKLRLPHAADEKIFFVPNDENQKPLVWISPHIGETEFGEGAEGRPGWREADEDDLADLAVVDPEAAVRQSPGKDAPVSFSREDAAGWDCFRCGDNILDHGPDEEGKYGAGCKNCGCKNFVHEEEDDPSGAALEPRDIEEGTRMDLKGFFIAEAQGERAAKMSSDLKHGYRRGPGGDLPPDTDPDGTLGFEGGEPEEGPSFVPASADTGEFDDPTSSRENETHDDFGVHSAFAQPEAGIRPPDPEDQAMLDAAGFGDDTGEDWGEPGVEPLVGGPDDQEVAGVVPDADFGAEEDEWGREPQTGEPSPENRTKVGFPEYGGDPDYRAAMGGFEGNKWRDPASPDEQGFFPRAPEKRRS